MPAVLNEAPNHSIETTPSIAQRRHFCIVLRGQIDKGWIPAFDLLSISSSEGCTTIDALVDQAALRGLLNRLWDLNLYIISVVEVDAPLIQNGGSQNE